MFEKIKRFFDIGLYTKEQVYKFFEKGVISEEQYNEIIGNGGEVGENGLG